MTELFSDSDSEVTLEVNKDYAERYNNWRQKEVLQKLKDRHGERALKKFKDDNDDDSSTSEEEDENAKELTQEIEKEFFRTLSCLKKQDPRIYDEKTKFFTGVGSQGKQNVASFKKSKEKKEEDKPLMLRDYERMLIIDREGKLSDDDDTDNTKKSTMQRSASPTLVQEQKALKDSFKNILENSDGEEDESNWGRLFTQRKKTQEEVDKEEEDYRAWLKGQKDQLPDKKVESDLKYLHDYWNDPNLDSNEAFLKDYILNRRFLDPENEDYIPSYNEIVHDSSEDLSDDERTVEKQDEFEHKYNFRFEEPDQEFIKRYSRTMENSLRRKDDRRKLKRQEIRERKEHEKEVKREEIKQLKALKRKELMEKIEKLKLITGNTDLGFKDEDLEEDFNPEEYDKRMSELFNDEYYGVEDEDGRKPEFPELDQELELEKWDNWNGETNYEIDERGNDYNHEPHCEDPDFIMDCDYDPKAELQRELIRASKKKKKNRRVSKFAEVLSKTKPLFNPEDQTFDDYVEEYYKMDFEDIIGNMPCRFKYRKVVPNSFGLSVDEILKADDKELNHWCSLKKTIQHRPENVEIYDVKAYQRKAANENLKKRVLVSLYLENPDEEDEDEVQHTKKRKISSVDDQNGEGVSKKGKKKKKSKHRSTVGESLEEESCRSTVGGSLEGESCRSTIDESAEGGNYKGNDISAAEATVESIPPPKKKRKKKKKKQKLQPSEINHDSSVHHNSPSSHEISHDFSNKIQVNHNTFSKKRKKHKNTHDSHLPEISDSRLKAYGLNPKKFKNKLLYKK